MILPEAFLDQMRARLGDELDEFQDSLDRAPVTSIRLNPGKTVELPFAKRPVPWHPEGYYLEERPSFVADPAFHAGAYYVQEASSMILHQALRQWLDPDTPVRALDLTAAPGGKTTLLEAALPEGSMLLANEVIRGRFNILRENCVRWGGFTHVSNHDPRDLGELEGFFDLMLVDAPCSGEGMFRKEEDALRNWSPEQVRHCALRQQRILHDALPLLRPGGLLIYSTCTYNAPENEGHASWLKEAFGLIPLELELPASWGIETRDPGFQLYPHRLQGEGFYFAGYRSAGSGRTKIRAPRTFHRLSLLSGKKKSRLGKWLPETDDCTLVETPTGRIRAFPAPQQEACMILEHALQRLVLGRELGQFKGSDFIPSHEMALGRSLPSGIAALELDRAQALSYLKRETPENLEIPVGWHCMTFKGLGLGWMKGLGRRANNYLPASWRIRAKIG